PIKRGRDFTAQDKSDTQRVTIIDERLARHFWPGYPGGPDPLGQHLLLGGTNPKPAEIIGVVADVHLYLDEMGWPGCVYQPLLQTPQKSAMLALRTAGDPLKLVPSARAQVLAMDRDQPVSAVKTTDDRVAAGLGQRRLMAALLG